MRCAVQNAIKHLGCAHRGGGGGQKEVGDPLSPQKCRIMRGWLGVFSSSSIKSMAHNTAHIFIPPFILMRTRTHMHTHTCTHTFAITIFLQLGLLEVRMTLHLVHSWDNLGCLQEVFCLGDGKVGDTNSFDKTFLHQTFHGLCEINRCVPATS